MALETASYVDALVVTNPDGSDQRSTADDHLRLIKAALKRSFPMVAGAVSASHQALCYVNDLSASVQAQLNTLRDGSETAKYAANATNAATAANAAALGGVAAAGFAQLTLNNIFTGNVQTIRAADFAGWALYNTSAAADWRYWIPNYVVGNACYSYVFTDTGAAGFQYMAVTRSATYVEAIAFYAGTMTFNGQSLTNPIQLNSIPAGSFARNDIAQTFNGGAGTTIISLADANPVTPNCEQGNVFRVVMSGSRTFNAPQNARSGQTIVLHLVHNANGNVGYWSTAYKFAGATPPTLSTVAGQVDVLAFNYDSVSGVWRQAGLNVG